MRKDAEAGNLAKNLYTVIKKGLELDGLCWTVKNEDFFSRQLGDSLLA